MNTIHETSVEHSNKRISSNNDNINLNKDGVNNNKNSESVTNEGAGEETKSGSLVVSDISNNNNDNDNNACGLTDNNDSKILSIVKNSVAQKIAPAQSTSRIARPCLGHQKPAVPLTPTKIGSMDTIWETYPHRLNEAGLNRYADTSVLTEDTDSFIIGEKVWVAGTKPGQIAYIGETQFAPGEWAGIVLDSPIGKNDGSVGGTRYFQCEPKRGVFSRLTRLMRTPLPGVDESFLTTPQAHSVTSTPFHNGTRARTTSPLSPPASINNLRKSPSLSTSNTSLASVTHVVDFKVGDRVIIKSSQGSKVGTLRYLGTTSFACGEWCGVELDDPRGKNDGSVEGIRYFQCVPQFGLFAPVTKVSKSPLKYKPGNCVLHSGAKLSSSGLKRMGSKESMTSFTSMASSMASTTSGARRVRLGVNSLTPQVTFKGL